MVYLLELLFAGAVLGAIYGLVGLGFTLIYKSTQTINIAHGEMLMLLSFVCYFFSAQAGLPFWLAVVLTFVTAFVLGLTIERLFLRPLIGQPLIAVIMMTVGLASVFHALVLALWGPMSHSYPAYLPEATIRIWGAGLPGFGLVSLAVIGLVLLVLALFFKFTRLGLAMRATADDQLAAQSTGIRVRRIFGLAWGISAMTAALGGLILGTMFGFDYMAGQIGLKAFPGIILGGLDSLAGAVAGGMIIGVVENLAGGYLDRYLVGIRDIAPYAFMLLVLMIRPYGLWGTRKIERI